MTSERVIGKDGRLPWKISEDLKLFKQLTTNQTVIMGRKTLDSIIEQIGHALPNRKNVVVGRTPYREQNLYVCGSIKEAVDKANSFGTEVYVIGGASVYGQTLPMADEMYVSYVNKNYEGDTFFPEFNKSEWDVLKRLRSEEFELVHYKRKKGKLNRRE